MWWIKKKKHDSVPSPENRRKLERIRNILTILCRKEGENEDFRIYTDNVSMGGVKFITQEHLDVGNEMRMIILLHSIHTQITARGAVTWINSLGKQQFEGGIEFISMEAEDQKRFNDFIMRYRMDVTGGAMGL